MAWKKLVEMNPLEGQRQGQAEVEHAASNRTSGSLPPLDAEAVLRQDLAARHVRLKAFPSTINLELTGQCNIKPPCTFCVGKHGDYREPGHLSDSELEQYMPFLAQCHRVNDCSFGEPLLYPGFETIIAWLAKREVQFGFTTNGLLLNEHTSRFLVAHAHHVEFVVSLNAATARTYFHYHGQDFALIMDNLERFAGLHRAAWPGKPLPLIVSFIVMRSNREEVFAALRLALRLGASRVMLRHLFDLRTRKYSCAPFGYKFFYEKERLSVAEYQQLETQVRASAEFDNLPIDFTWNPRESFMAEQALPGVNIPCLFPWRFLCIRPLHDWYAPCAFLKQGIGRTSRSSVAEIWNGEVMIEMRSALANGQIPQFCLAHGDACPLVLNQRNGSPKHRLWALVRTLWR